MNTNDDTNFSALLERIYFGNGDAFRNEHGFPCFCTCFTNSHATAAMNNAKAIAYVVENGLSLLKKMNDPITVNSFLVVVIATAGTAPKYLTMIVYNQAPKKNETDRKVKSMK